MSAGGWRVSCGFKTNPYQDCACACVLTPSTSDGLFTEQVLSTTALSVPALGSSTWNCTHGPSQSSPFSLIRSKLWCHQHRWLRWPLPGTPFLPCPTHFLSHFPTVCLCRTSHPPREYMLMAYLFIGSLPL